MTPLNAKEEGDIAEYLSVNGVGRFEVQRHAYASFGRPVLVFLHEGLGCVALWKGFPERLCAATRCDGFVFSRLGYGRSDPSPLPWKLNFMHTQAFNILPRVLKSAGIKEHILVGHSDGGSIALLHGGGPHAADLKGIITMAAHVFCEPVTTAAIEAARQAYLTRDLKTKLSRYHGANTDNAFRGWNDVWLHPGFIHWNIEKYLSRIRVPVLALQGRDDQYGTPAQLAAIAAGVPRCASHLIDHCRHSPHLEQPEAVLAHAAGFISRLTG